MHRAVVAHLEIAGNHGQGLKRFYASLFGWRIQDEHCAAHVAYWIDADSAGIHSTINSPDHSGIIPYIDVDDVLENLCYAEELGGRILEPPREITCGGRAVTVALFVDPAGNRVGLSNGFDRRST
jgi:predicted enzyme related to lactoylglutathione lyase